MSAIWNSHATELAKYLDCNNELQAHLYLEQLLLFPVDIQDKIIEEISHLSQCNQKAVADIISYYTIRETKQWH